LRIGVADRAASALLLPALGRLARTVPGITVEVCDDGDDREHRDAVLHGTLDVALGDMPADPGLFAARCVLEDPVVLLARADSMLARRPEPPTLEDLSRVSLIADRGWPTLALIEARMRATGLVPPAVLHAEMTAGVQALVAANIGAALLPRMAVDDGDHRVVVIDLGHLVPPRRVGLYWHADRRLIAGVEALVTAVVAVVAAGAARRPERRFGNPPEPAVAVTA
jgi:DNA-binding transcriptional LysR family regulator